MEARGGEKCERVKVSADGPLTDAQLVRQVLDGILPSLAEQVQELLAPLHRAHTFHPPLASMAILYGLMR